MIFNFIKRFFIIFVCIKSLFCPAFALSTDEASDKLAQMLLSANSHQQFMYYLINKKDYETVKLFAEAGKVDLNQTYCGLTPLVYALYYKRPDIAILLLEHGADPKKQTPGGGSALYFAVKYGYSEVVEKILQDPNLDINRERMFFRKPYVKTAHNNGYFEIEKMLIEHQKQYEASHPSNNVVIPAKNTYGIISVPQTDLPKNTDAI